MTPPFSPGAREKLHDLASLLERFGRPRTGTLVFTNGVFDVLHRGHVEYLEAARALGDHLVVGLNGDASVRRLKGPTRPVNPQEDRAVVLGGLAAVDAVVLFDEDTPLRLVEALLPDVIVKGGDYQPDTVVGAREVVAAGGRVVIAPLREGRSTTRIVQRIQGTEGP
jgi:D-beta-D-heptose 7-phosphate kinase/D-beta-D-heptose 1-phosphate adenosyltransferase